MFFESEAKRLKQRSDVFSSLQLCFFFFCFFVCVIFFFRFRFKGNREKWFDHGFQNRAVELQFEWFPVFWHRPVFKL